MSYKDRIDARQEKLEQMHDWLLDIAYDAVARAGGTKDVSHAVDELRRADLALHCMSHIVEPEATEEDEEGDEPWKR